MEFGSLCVHSGQEPDPATGAVIPPLSLSTTFAQSEVGVHKGFEYSRSGNPTRAGFETAIAALEGAKYGLAFSSGSATTASVINLLKSGSHLISVNDVYGGTYRYFTKVAQGHGVQVSLSLDIQG
jgi:cystathionine gamma-lyase